jgi:hypothetical protein
MDEVKLRQSVNNFLERMNTVTGEMHEAIEQADVDAQQMALDAIIGLCEMLKSAAENNDSEDT